jgi:hypothetical protein
MKKNIRKIVVADKEYVWRVAQVNEDNGSLLLKIWQDKKLIVETYILRNRLTPKDVKGVIEYYKLGFKGLNNLLIGDDPLVIDVDGWPIAREDHRWLSERR